MKITWRVGSLIIAGIAVVQLTAGVVRVDRERTLFERDVEEEGRVLGRALGLAIEATWRSRGEAEALSIMRSIAERDSLGVRWVWLDDAASPRHRPIAAADELAALRRGRSTTVRVGEGTSSSAYTYVPVDVPGQRRGAIEIEDPLHDEAGYLKRSIFSALLTSGVLILLSGAIIMVLGYRLIAHPIRHLVDHVQHVARGDFERRATVTADDELSELARQLNRMSDELASSRARLAEESRARIEALEQLRHADRLSSVGTLASGLAHELGTPINVIEGHAQLLREEDSAPEQVRSTSLIITRQCKRMAQIIRQLLDFSRARGPVDQSCDAREVSEQTLRMLEPLFRRQGIDVVFDPGESDCRVNLPANELQQSLLNIAVNGAHAMGSGGTLTLTIDGVRAVRPDNGDVERDYVRVRIRDTGDGMDAETVRKIFEPFFTTKDVGDGTGLGLSVAYGIISGRKGWIDVDSQLRLGTTFALYLPVGGAY